MSETGEPPDPPARDAQHDVGGGDPGEPSVTEFVDASGKVIRYLVNPLGVEFRFRDVAELLVGACVLAIPVSFTEEVWVLGEELPMMNALLISLLSGAFVALFVYVKSYQGKLGEHLSPFVRRVLATYFVTLAVAALLLALLQKLPLADDPATAIKRIFLVAFPASFSATVVDSLK